MTLTLKHLMPQIVDVKIQSEMLPEPVIVSIVPLSYAEYQDCAIGVDIPSVPTKTVMRDNKKQEVPDLNDPDYQRAYSEANTTIALRRVGLALSKAGYDELKGKSQDEQVAILREMDTGVVNALTEVLASLARRKRGEVFRTKPVSGNGHADLSSNGVEPEPVAES